MPMPATHLKIDEVTGACEVASSGESREMQAHLLSYQRANRADWIDVARGLIIILVVVGHVVSGLLDAALLPRTALAMNLYAALHTFRMPALFVISGLLLQRRLAKGVKPFLQKVASGLVWPYMLWGTIQMLVIAAMAAYVNTPIQLDWDRLLRLPWAPPSQYWFLQALALFHVVSTFCLRLDGVRSLGIMALGLLVLKPAVDAHFGPWVSNDAMLYSMYPFYFAFYVLGAALGPWLLDCRHLIEGSTTRRCIMIFLVTGTLWMALVGSVVQQDPTKMSATSITCAVAGVIACFSLALFPRINAMGVLPYIGQHGLSVLVLHVFFIAGTRILVSRFLGWHEPISLFFGTLTAGIAGPLVVFEVSKRVGKDKLLGLA